MEKRGVSLAEIQEVPKESLTLLVGPPGAGKSAFCHRMVLNSMVAERPVIFVTTEQRPSGITGLLREKGMGEPTPGALSFVDAFAQTVGLATSERPDTIGANCEDLNSMSMAIAKLQQRIARKDFLLAFDSLTSPYLFNEKEVFRFMRLCLLRFAAEGNSVVALVDEGCGKEEDLVAMMSVADGVIKMEMGEDRQLLNVVKHPKLRPTRIEVPTTPSMGLKPFTFDRSMARQFFQAETRKDEAWFRKEIGDFVNLFWPNLAHWSGMLWDPKRFPTMMYEVNKQEPYRMIRDNWSVFPWKMRLLWKLLMPKSLSKVKDVKRVAKFFGEGEEPWDRSWIGEYLEDVSKTDEHYIRIHESYECWGFENIGATVASHFGPENAGLLKALGGLKGLERDWNAVETKCIGLGDPYCEFKFVPGEIDELRDSLEKDSSVIERIHERLMDRLTGFLIGGRPLVERPRLGSDIHLHPVGHAMGFPHVAGERYRMALRMGGARSGKEVGERLVDAGLREDEAVNRLLHLLEHCKVGKVTAGETIRIEGNCESFRESLSVTKREEPSCYFTTGFLNGFFSAVKNQHVKETKCIGMGDPYCEWEIM
jgi:predicted hydrocarbon binding protein/KaiC/GvpD/RAD55 family RecA-like ATPase